MKFMSYIENNVEGIAVEVDGTFKGMLANNSNYPGNLLSLIETGGSALNDAYETLKNAAEVSISNVDLLPPVSNPEKVICVGLNYVDHSKESGFETPDYPTLFGRFNSSLIGHGAPILRPEESIQLDYEGELAAIIGKKAYRVSEDEALDHVAGYSVFNDGSIRDYQHKAPQWTPGKNFDDTGAFGPHFVTADVLPKGCLGLQLTTRLNGMVVQETKIDDMVFSVASLVSIISQFMTLNPGDVIVTGTPGGIGLARTPPLFMKDGDVCEVEIESIGILNNPIKDRVSQ
ncbi:MAG: fumarylacetoacetate hydrolase family protein [OCS116 cluster bacterium]|nr:fumarylacetoacetate hydrolase family protein [OCS116 cluster bacterium]